MNAESVTSMRELDCRFSGGLQVRLLWCEEDGRLWVSVIDRGTGEAFRVEVGERERPVDVFNHPFVYAAEHRVDTHAANGVARSAAQVA